MKYFVILLYFMLAGCGTIYTNENTCDIRPRVKAYLKVSDIESATDNLINFVYDTETLNQGECDVNK